MTEEDDRTKAARERYYKIEDEYHRASTEECKGFIVELKAMPLDTDRLRSKIASEISRRRTELREIDHQIELRKHGMHGLDQA